MTFQEQNVDEAQIGRVLHYILENGKCRPALVLEDWGGTGTVNLIVFPDGSNDGKEAIDNHQHNYEAPGLLAPTIGGPHVPNTARSGPANAPLVGIWKTSVKPEHKVKKSGSWHWPRECAGMN